MHVLYINKGYNSSIVAYIEEINDFGTTPIHRKGLGENNFGKCDDDGTIPGCIERAAHGSSYLFRQLNDSVHW